MRILFFAIGGKMDNLAGFRAAAHYRALGCSFTLRFQGWVIGAYDKGGVTWKQWVAAKGNPRNLKLRRRVSLPLFEGEDE
jgi:hypothetical protein